MLSHTLTRGHSLASSWSISPFFNSSSTNPAHSLLSKLAPVSDPSPPMQTENYGLQLKLIIDYYNKLINSNQVFNMSNDKIFTSLEMNPALLEI